jgi:hypothetical protein
MLASGNIVLTVMMGSWFGRVLSETGITSSIIRKAVELGGDKPFVICALLSLVVMGIFTSSFGSGVVIAIGIIVLPILFALGVPRALATTSFIMSIASGTFINAVYYNQLSSMIPGYPNDMHFYMFGFAAMAINEICIFIMLAIGLRKEKPARNWAASVDLPQGNAPVWSFICPIVPVLMAMIFGWPTLPSFIFAIFTALLLTGRLFDRKNVMNLILKAAHDGINDVSMLCVMVIMLQIYITIAGVNTPIFNAMLGPVMPRNPLILVIAIGLLAPIALFRGPLMWWGVGAATVALLGGLSIFSVPLLFQLMLVPTTFMATAICPTQGWNIWSLGFTKLTPKDIFKHGFVPAWASCIICSFLAYFMS